MSLKIGICGYGNLGRGTELAVNKAPDMELCAVFTRRSPESIKTVSGVKVVSLKDASLWQDKLDVMILCGGSATDLDSQTPMLAEMFNVVDSFDTHAKIPEHFEAVNAAALKNNHTAVISAGWDPGMFSVMRLYGNAILPDGADYTFWGRGVSQGHSDAIRRVKGVKDAKQYTVPVEEAVKKVRSGSSPELSTREKHTRECYVVPEEGADLAQIKSDIKNMPNYFSDYDTTVTFITEEELKRDHSGLPHGGFVIRTGSTSDEHKHVIEYSLKLDSNPEFTGSAVTAVARAAARFAKEGAYGCKTIFDIPPAYLSAKSAEELRKEIL